MLTLFLQSSSGAPMLALLDGGAVVYAQAHGQMQRLDYGTELRAALASAGRGVDALAEIVVDIGPGRLGSTRAAVAFANGLAYARNLPVSPLNAILMLGACAEATHGKPCLVLRSAARKQYHWGLVQGGRIIEAGFAPDGVISPQYKGPVLVAGDGDPERVALANAQWLELNAVPAAALAHLAPHLKPARGPVVPLTDTTGLTDG